MSGCTCDPGPEGQHAGYCGCEPEDWGRAGELLTALGIKLCGCKTPLHTMRCGIGGHVRVMPQ